MQSTHDASPVEQQFVQHGVFKIDTSPIAERMEAMLGQIRQSRSFDESLFLDEAAYRADPQYRGVNPKAGGFNLLERLDDDFVMHDPAVDGTLRAVLGDYEINLKKVICGIPRAKMPKWVYDEVSERPIPNLGQFIKPEYRDITYFYGIDYHQDIIDFPGGVPDFITLYYYIHPVAHRDAPLHLLTDSHSLGFSTFPHAIQRLEEGVRYRNGDDEMLCQQLELVGPAGTCYMWHPYMLHGTGNVEGEEVRLSLRYLIRSKNKVLAENSTSMKTRTDLADDGAFVSQGNFIKSV